MIKTKRQQIKALLKRLLNPDVSKREPIEEIATDKWFTTASIKQINVITYVVITLISQFLFKLLFEI